MSSVTFADVVHQSVAFSREIPSQQLILDLIDTPWVQRLRDISQTANTRLVYMFSEHSRFGHSLGVAYLADTLMQKLAKNFGDQIAPYRNAVAAAAILHDIGHIAPGSHTAFKTWFPGAPDIHEQFAGKIIESDERLSALLRASGPDTPELVASILAESDALPPWCWQIISGGGWNVDRGNWCIVDSILAGVSYGRYNIPALTETIVLTPDGGLALGENRLDAMMHFAISRHAMYRQLYQHRVILAADTLNRALVLRARDARESLPFLDEHMERVLHASTPSELTTEGIFHMRESWWRYHLMRWSRSSDTILADLSERLLNRRLFKTVRVREDEDPAVLLQRAEDAVRQAGYDPRYYLHQVSTSDMHASDLEQSMPVLMENGSVRRLLDVDPLFKTLLRETQHGQKHWIVLPREAKELLGRPR